MSNGAVKGLLDTSLAVQSGALLAENIRATKAKKNLAKLGVTNIVGISLLREQGKIIGSL